MTLGSGVASIGYNAFSDCPLLMEATFLGKAPILGNQGFFNTSSQFKVYFIQGSAGFTTPTWQGYPSVALPKVPDIAVQQPVGSNLIDGVAKKNFGSKAVASSTVAKSYTISNVGTGSLTGLVITKDGTNAGDFIVTAPVKTTLAPGETTTFTVKFKPTATGTRNAAIHIGCNDPDENPFDIKLAGLGT